MKGMHAILFPRPCRKAEETQPVLIGPCPNHPFWVQSPSYSNFYHMSDFRPLVCDLRVMVTMDNYHHLLHVLQWTRIRVGLVDTTIKPPNPTVGSKVLGRSTTPRLPLPWYSSGLEKSNHLIRTITLIQKQLAESSQRHKNWGDPCASVWGQNSADSGCCSIPRLRRLRQADDDTQNLRSECFHRGSGLERMTTSDA